MMAKQPTCAGRRKHLVYSKDGKTRRTWTFDVHEVRVWRLHKSLELVPLLFRFLGGVEKIDGERLSSGCQHIVVPPISWAMLTMTTRGNGGGDGRQGFVRMGGIKVWSLNSDHR